MGGAWEARIAPFAAALAVAACLATPDVHAAPLVSQFRADTQLLTPGSENPVPCKALARFAGYDELHAANEEEAAPPALSADERTPGSPWRVILGQLRVRALLLFLFPQYTGTIASPPPAPPSLVEMQPVPLTSVVLNSVEAPWPFDFSLPPLTPPPVSEAPEPTTLLSAAVGACLIGAFGCWRRRNAG
jgi:hypothetical protein